MSDKKFKGAIKPLYDRVLVKRLESEQMTAGGIIIPDTAQEKTQYGTVVATGDGKIPFGSRTDKIYQIIFPMGIFYNVALYQKAGVRAVFLLKGNYKLTSDAIEGTFVRNSIMTKNINEEQLHLLPAKLEAGSISAFHLPNRLPPVGFGGQLLEVYADKTIRILRGKTPQFERPALYVMEPVNF
jgi:hypothetical protein